MRNTTSQQCLLGFTFVLTACASVQSTPDGEMIDEPSAITVDDKGFFVDQQVRWSGVASPTVTGTISGPATAVEVRFGTTIATATVADATWSVTLDNLATPSDVTFVARDESADLASITRTFAIDLTPPVIAAMPTEIANELNDIVSFGADGTISSHLHTTANQTTLGSDGCPDVFKHAYLMDGGDSNPIRWQLRATDDGVGLDAEAALVRIGKKDGSQFSAWQPIAGSGARDLLDFEIDALRTDHAFLGTTEAEMVIQLSTKDRLDREVIFERCWNHHPLAVPLLVKSANQAAGHPLALQTNRLESGFFFHQLAEAMINPDSAGLSMLDYDLFNGSDESAIVTISLNRPRLFTRRDYVRQTAAKTVRDLDTAQRIRCNDDDTNPRCEVPNHPQRFASTGSTLEESPERFVVRVVEIAADGSLGTEVPCITCNANAGVWTFDVAGKTSSSAPGRQYRVMTGVRELTNLFPSGASGDLDDGPFAETTLRTTVGDFGIVGRLIGNKHSGCTKFQNVPIGNTGNSNTFCVQETDFQHYRALTRIEIAFVTPLLNQPAASPAAGVTPRANGTLAAARKLQGFSYDSIEQLPAGF